MHYARIADRDDLLPPLFEALITFLSLDRPGDFVRGVFCAGEARGLRLTPGLAPLDRVGFATAGRFGRSLVGCDNAGPAVESRMVASAAEGLSEGFAKGLLLLLRLLLVLVLVLVPVPVPVPVPVLGLAPPPLPVPSFRGRPGPRFGVVALPVLDVLLAEPGVFRGRPTGRFCAVGVCATPPPLDAKGSMLASTSACFAAAAAAALFFCAEAEPAAAAAASFSFFCADSLLFLVRDVGVRLAGAASAAAAASVARGVARALARLLLPRAGGVSLSSILCFTARFFTSALCGRALFPLPDFSVAAAAAAAAAPVGVRITESDFAFAFAFALAFAFPFPFVALAALPPLAGAVGVAVAVAVAGSTFLGLLLTGVPTFRGLPRPRFTSELGADAAAAFPAFPFPFPFCFAPSALLPPLFCVILSALPAASFNSSSSALRD